MKKNISKEQIIDTTLELLKDKSDIRTINLREIARVLGCAHTNLYNYFPSFQDLLWEAHMEIEHIDDIQPEIDKIVTEKAVNTMIELLEDIWLHVYPEVPDKERIHGVLHDVHCYIVGEVSNFINGRGFIQDKELLKQHIAKSSVTFFTLSLREEHGI